MKKNTEYFIYLVNANSSSQMGASWSAVWRATNPPFNLWSEQASVMCSIVYGLGLLPHLQKLARQLTLTYSYHVSFKCVRPSRETQLVLLQKVTQQ